ncbi:insulin receptor substrate 1-B [Lates japonicus]|uniref:Insulin receptor substrate 1-B n=1 Tax=Lates japonicus TaxID=270547 RepID=A0AAD3NKS2_LATJO|nr:insulin receptor substrate 1-B [Lates japonicus]
MSVCSDKSTPGMEPAGEVGDSHKLHAQFELKIWFKIVEPTDSGAAGDCAKSWASRSKSVAGQVWPKGLGQAKSRWHLRLCLTDKTVNFVKLNSDAAAVVLQLMSDRRPPRTSSLSGGTLCCNRPGEFWMQLEVAPPVMMGKGEDGVSWDHARRSRASCSPSTPMAPAPAPILRLPKRLWLHQALVKPGPGTTTLLLPKPPGGSVE